MHNTQQTKNRLFAFAAVALLTFAMAGCKANELPPNVSLTPDPAWVTGIEAPGKSQAQHDAPLYFPRVYSHTRLLPSGDVHQYHQFVIKGNEASAVLNEARQGFVFNPAFQRLEVHFFGLHRQGDSFDFKEKAKTQLVHLRNDLPGVYSGQVQAIFEMPEARPTDTLEIRFSTIGSNPVFAGKPWHWQAWHFTGPVLERVHETSWHNSLPVNLDVWASGGGNRMQDSPDAQTTRTTQGDWTMVHHSATQLERPRFDELPAKGWPQTDVIQATTFQSWDEVLTWATTLFDQPAKPSSVTYQTLLAELRQHPTQAEQAMAALRWVQREIRYVSLSLAENSHLPYAPDEVLARRFGDCKDKSLLLAHLLRDLGLKAHPALMSQQNPKAPSRVAPAPMFDHAVVAVWINDQLHVIDATLPEEVSSLAYLTPWHAGADLLVLDKTSKGFVTAPLSAPLGVNRLTSNEAMTFQTNGRSGVLSVEMVHEGVFADRTRWHLAHHGIEAAKVHYLDEMRKRFPNAQWADEPKAIDEPATNTLTLKGRFAVGNPLKRAPNNRWRFEYFSGDVLDKLPVIGGIGRLNPLDLGPYKKQVVLRRTLNFPTDWQADEDGYDESIQHDVFKAQVRRTVSNTHIADEWQLTIKDDSVELSDLPSYLEAVQALESTPTQMQLRAP